MAMVLGETSNERTLFALPRHDRRGTTYFPIRCWRRYCVVSHYTYIGQRGFPWSWGVTYYSTEEQYGLQGLIGSKLCVFGWYIVPELSPIYIHTMLTFSSAQGEHDAPACCTHCYHVTRRTDERAATVEMKSRNGNNNGSTDCAAHHICAARTACCKVPWMRPIPRRVNTFRALTTAAIWLSSVLLYSDGRRGTARQVVVG